MQQFTRLLKNVRTLAAPVVALAFVGGCLIPGVNDATGNDGNTGGGADLIVAPQRISPLAEENLSNVLVGLAWSTVPGATHYDVYFGLDPNPPLVASVTNPNFDLLNLPACATHYWRVVARNDTQSISSPTWKFKTQCP